MLRLAPGSDGMVAEPADPSETSQPGRGMEMAEDERRIQRQAFAGMIWSKQFFHYDLPEEEGQADLGAYVLVWRPTAQNTTLIPKVNWRWPWPFSPVMVPNAVFAGAVLGPPNCTWFRAL